MAHINIVGRLSEIDEAVNKYISKYDIQLEEGNYTSPNIYAKYFEKARSFVEMIEGSKDSYKVIEEDVALQIIDDIERNFYERDEILQGLEEKKQKAIEMIKKLENFINLDITVSHLNYFDFIECKLGRMPISNYKQFESFLHDFKEIIFIESQRDDVYVYGVYFCTREAENEVKDILYSLNFREEIISFEFDDLNFRGTLKNVHEALENRLLTIKDRISIVQDDKLHALGLNKEDIMTAFIKIKQLYSNQNIKKHLIKVNDDFYVFAGWMSVEDAESLNLEIEKDSKLIFTIDNTYKTEDIPPPIKLKNNKVFEPFEFFVKTYGLPMHNEIDPTPFLAITYTLLFGLMFGDVGQGALITFLGMYLHQKKGMEFGKIVSTLGLSSTAFGLLYGSVFGFEELIPAVWVKPAEGIYEILGVSLALGVVLILTSMILNMINAIKQKDLLALYFSPNGIAGFVFYICIIFSIFLVLTNQSNIILVFTGGLAVLALLVIGFRETINAKLLGKEKEVHGSSVIHSLESIIEVFEIVLTYFTNTLSFIRVGAFALSHAGIMSVVWLLSTNAEGNHNFLIVLFGNLLVIATEGFIAGIQALRMQFYEMFSRYYKGRGAEFKSCRNLEH